MSERMTDDEWRITVEHLEKMRQQFLCGDPEAAEPPEHAALCSIVEEAIRARAAEDAERARAGMVEQTRDGLLEQVGRLEAALSGFVSVADRENEHALARGPLASPWWPEDHACIECRPEATGWPVEQGFRCALHTAKALLHQTETPKP